MLARLAVVALGLAGCGFEVAAGLPVDAALADTAPLDDPPLDAAPSLCATDPALRLCFGFDQVPLPPTVPNEGVAAVDAALTDITSTPRSPDSGAALFGASSSIYLPMHADVSSILTIEIWFRIDTMPGNGGRSGLVDSNVVPPNISLFFYRQNPGHTLRCGLGGQTEVFDAPLATGDWLYAACTCDGTNLSMYLDGIKLGERPGACGSAGALVGDGFTIGSDNTGNPSVFADRIAGAIDGVRLWSVERSEAEICAQAGLSGC